MEMTLIFLYQVDEDVGVKFTERVEVVEVPKQRKESVR